MKKLTIVLFLVLMFSVQAQAADPYGYDTESPYQRNVYEKYPNNYNQGNQSINKNRAAEQKNVLIKGEWDTHGKHYTPAGPENKWRQDGTLMQKAAGGYIDTKTGKFVPSTE